MEFRRSFIGYGLILEKWTSNLEWPLLVIKITNVCEYLLALR